MNGTVAGLRTTVRALLRQPTFSAMCVATLALGIGGNTAVFSVVHGVLIQPLAFEDPDRLVAVWNTAPGIGADVLAQAAAIHYTYRDSNQTLLDVGLWDPRSVTVTGLEEPEQLAGIEVTEGVFELLGVRPMIGRLFTAADDAPDATETVVLSHGYWQRRLGADPNVIGFRLIVNGQPHTVIGVLPPGLSFLDQRSELFLPARIDREHLTISGFSYRSIARLKDGVSVEQASRDLERLMFVAVDRYPLPEGMTVDMARQAGFAPLLEPLKKAVVGDVDAVLWVLLGAVGLVLLIACANVANLLLVRAEGRRREIAVRTALGASRRRLVVDLLRESIVIGLLAGVVGLWLAWAGIRLLTLLEPEHLPRLADVSISWTVVAFDLTVSLVAGLIFGLIPIVRSRAVDIVSALKEGGRGASEGASNVRARNVLVVVQVAMALVLLVGCGLMLRSFVALRDVHPGFENPEQVQTLRISVPSGEVADDLEAARVFEAILHRLAAVPGVDSVGAASSVTMDGTSNYDIVEFEDFPTEGEEVPDLRCVKPVLPGYVETMGNRVVAGRTIDWNDIHDHSPVVMITENLAREYWNSPAAAVGRRVRPEAGDPWREIVGVVGDVRQEGIDQPATAVVFYPMVIAGFHGEEIRVPRTMSYVVRSRRVGTPALMDDLKAAVWSVNPNLPLADVQTLDEILLRSLARTSFTLVLLGIAAAVSLLLGLVGIYAVTSYAVSRRTPEFGIRVALGAQQSDVIGLVVTRGAVVIGVGILAGLVAAVGLTRLMAAMLFGVTPLDPVTYVTVTVAVAATALVASLVPARRAAGVDPMTALRAE
jgi:predicted permease